MRTLITGCAGFAGSHLAEYLLGKDEEVIGLRAPDDDCANLQHIKERLNIVGADLREIGRVREVIESLKPQRIYHLAASSSPAESFEDPERTYHVNFMGTLNLLSAWLRAGMECRFLLVSSAEVYGMVPREKLPLREEMEPRPVNPYAGSKAAAEILALQFFRSYGLPIVLVRPFNHTGPRQSPRFVCSNLARQVAEIELGLRPPTVVAGNLDAARDFTDVRDIVRGYFDLLEHGALGEVYQLCSGHSISIRSVLGLLTSCASKPIQVSVDNPSLRKHDAPEIWGDYSKAKLAVGWEPRRKLTDTLRELTDYWREKVKLKA
ncbi:MAG: GDP-mannose 4,6-dehydratase [Terriglobia bacterium]|jgi:GDP-4-dehydro-6-deoxy-D-mannose reductase